MKQDTKVYVVVAAYNEAKYINRFLEKLKTKTSNFIVVDDGSSDKTSQVASKYTQNLLVHSVNLGKGAAMKTGADYAFAHCDAKAVIFMDGDDQHDVEDLEKFYQLINQQGDNQLILGVRSFDNSMPLSRIIGNRIASFLVKILFGKYVPDIPSGFKAMSKSTYRQLRWGSNDYGVELEIACKAAAMNLPFTAVGVKTIYHDLDRGMNLTDPVKMIYKILLWRFSL